MIDVMGFGEVVERLGISPRQVHRITTRPDFPEPTRLTAGRVWDAEDVEQWIREHRPELGR